VRASRWIRPALAAACLAGLAWAVARLGPGRVLAVALRADPWWLLLSVPALAGRFLIWGLKWRRMLARRCTVPLGLVLRVLAAGSFVNLTTPTAKLAGGVVRAVLLRRRRGLGLATAYGWAMADQVTNVLGHVLLYALLAAAVAATLPGPWRGPLALSAALALAGLGALSALRPVGFRLLERSAVTDRLERFVPARLRRDDAGRGAAALLRDVLDPLLRAGGPAATFAGDVALAAAAFASLCVANALVLRALGVEAPLLVVSTILVVGYFAGVVFGAWGGIGVTEAAMTALYVRVGLSVDDAAAAALLHRAMYYALVLGWGGWSLLREGRYSATRSRTPV